MAVFNILTVAGSDSGGGAGIQADLKAIAALGGYGASVLTALTAQNTKGVQAVHHLPADFVTAQMRSLAEDIRIDAIKIGMLDRAEIVAAVADGLALFPDVPVILDPVMVAKSGHKLLADDAIDAIRELLVPKARLITPNLPEAAVLLGGSDPTDPAGMRAMAAPLRQLGCQAVLLKGGHLPGPICPDLLIAADDIIEIAGPRIETANTHGTGCTLSAAIAALLPQSTSLEQAIRSAINYLRGAIAMADHLTVGHGHGPVHHFYRQFPAE